MQKYKRKHIHDINETKPIWNVIPPPFCLFFYYFCSSSSSSLRKLWSSIYPSKWQLEFIWAFLLRNPWYIHSWPYWTNTLGLYIRCQVDTLTKELHFSLDHLLEDASIRQLTSDRSNIIRRSGGLEVKKTIVAMDRKINS